MNYNGNFQSKNVHCKYDRRDSKAETRLGVLFTPESHGMEHTHLVQRKPASHTGAHSMRARCARRAVGASDLREPPQGTWPPRTRADGGRRRCPHSTGSAASARSLLPDTETACVRTPCLSLLASLQERRTRCGCRPRHRRPSGGLTCQGARAL